MSLSIALTVTLSQQIRVRAYCCAQESIGTCADGTAGTPCCAYGGCNIFCCACNDGCRTLPTPYPTQKPTPFPTQKPTPFPTLNPTPTHTNNPSTAPTLNPIIAPTLSPSFTPTASTYTPTYHPSLHPTTPNPTLIDKHITSPTISPTSFEKQVDKHISTQNILASKGNYDSNSDPTNISFIYGIIVGVGAIILFIALILIIRRYKNKKRKYSHIVNNILVSSTHEGYIPPEIASETPNGIDNVPVNNNNEKEMDIVQMINVTAMINGINDEIVNSEKNDINIHSKLTINSCDEFSSDDSDTPMNTPQFGETENN